MELDRELLDQINGMDEETLSAGIGRIARNFGIDPQLAKRYLGDMSKVKEAVANLNQSDLDRITAALGKETAEQLANDIRREVKK